jgi:hypothetical protein
MDEGDVMNMEQSMRIQCPVSKRRSHAREFVFSRRELIAGVGAAALCGGACAAPVVSPCGAFREKERDVPLDEWADVIVAG